MRLSLCLVSGLIRSTSGLTRADTAAIQHFVTGLFPWMASPISPAAVRQDGRGRPIYQFHASIRAWRRAFSNCAISVVWGGAALPLRIRARCPRAESRRDSPSAYLAGADHARPVADLCRLAADVTPAFRCPAAYEAGIPSPMARRALVRAPRAIERSRDLASIQSSSACRP